MGRLVVEALSMSIIEFFDDDCKIFFRDTLEIGSLCASQVYVKEICVPRKKDDLVICKCRSNNIIYEGTGILFA